MNEARDILVGAVDRIIQIASMNPSPLHPSLPPGSESRNRPSSIGDERTLSVSLAICLIIK